MLDCKYLEKPFMFLNQWTNTYLLIITHEFITVTIGESTKETITWSLSSKNLLFSWKDNPLIKNQEYL